MQIRAGNESGKFERVFDSFQILVNPFPENATGRSIFGHAVFCYVQCSTSDVVLEGTCLSDMCNVSQT